MAEKWRTVRSRHNTVVHYAPVVPGPAVDGGSGDVALDEFWPIDEEVLTEWGTLGW